MASIALYYPWMHFQDTDWLKVALLSWEGIVRIRPCEVDDRDSEVVREIRGESDLLREITPSRDDLEEVAVAFDELLEDGGPAPRYGVSTLLRTGGDFAGGAPFGPFGVPAGRQPGPVTGEGVAFGSGGRSSWRPGERPGYHPELLWIYCGGAHTKVSDGLRRRLVATGAALQVDERDPWVGLHPGLGTVYLIALADAVACRNALSPVTDDPRMHHALGALDHLAALLDQPASRPRRDTPAAYAHLALRAAIRPERIATVPVSRLVRFRQRYAPELAAFRAHVDSLATELEQVANVENVEIAQAHLQALYERTTKVQLDELRRALRAFGIESVVGTLDMKVDLGIASGTALGALAWGTGQPTVGTAAVALTLVRYIAGRVKTHGMLRASSPVSYLLAAERMANR